MAKYRGASCRICRREKLKLFLKGERCYSDKCAFERRSYGPGQHGQARTRKVSDYALQLREKQKVRRIYGMLEDQFRHYFYIADRSKGVTGEVLLQLLERRLDNVIYRVGFASSRNQARQLVRHNHIIVNGVKVNIPSFLVNVDDEIGLIDKSKNNGSIADAVVSVARRGIPSWLSVDHPNFKGKVKSLPVREELTLPIQEQLIVELYSK